MARSKKAQLDPSDPEAYVPSGFSEATSNSTSVSALCQSAALNIRMASRSFERVDADETDKIRDLAFSLNSACILLVHCAGLQPSDVAHLGALSRVLNALDKKECTWLLAVTSRKIAKVPPGRDASFQQRCVKAMLLMTYADPDTKQSEHWARLRKRVSTKGLPDVGAFEKWKTKYAKQCKCEIEIHLSLILQTQSPEYWGLHPDVLDQQDCPAQEQLRRKVCAALAERELHSLRLRHST